MIKHYLKIALRNLYKQKFLTAINILGLSIGIACFSLFLLYAVNEFNFDRFHAGADNIYRVNLWAKANEGKNAGGDIYLPMPVGPAMKKELPGIKDFVRMQEAWGENFVKHDDKMTRIPMSFADPNFFSVFSFPIKSGNQVTPLKQLNSVVLSESTAKKIFGNADPVGQQIEIKTDETFEPFTITAVAADAPSNSSITFDMLCNYEYLATTKNGKRSVNNWNRSAYMTYVTLQPGSKLYNDRKLLQDFYNKYYAEDEADMRKRGYWKGEGSSATYALQPMRTMHTDTTVGGGIVGNINPKNVWILLGIAGAVLFIACINFTTLAIGRSAGRAKEIGLRKVMGGGKKILVAQFLAEALLLSIFSAALGLVMAQLLLPSFNHLSGRELAFSFSQFPEMIWLIAGLTLLTGLLAGSYPALVLSGFNPIEAMKQKIKISGSNVFTKSLVTLQFVLSTGLIASTVIILQQTNFMSNKHPGFNKENIVVINADDTDTKKIYPLFREAALKQSQVMAIAGSELGLGEGTGWSRSGFFYEGKHKNVYEYFVDHEFIPLMHIPMVAGRNFDPRIPADTATSVIINEAMVKDFGWTVNNAVGKQLKGYSDDLTPVVIGVVKDFNFQSLRTIVKPQLFHQFSSYKPYKFFVRIKPGNPAPVLAALESSWKSVASGFPLRYSFLDDDLDRFYKSESRWGNIVGWAGGISVFLACLGLLGLAALAAVNRTKEIGIRKVLGASISSILVLLSKDFLKLVIVALFIAAPLAWYFMNKWLEDFAYRISISGWIFVVTSIVAILIAFITIAIQVVRAAVVNPVQSLRSE